MPGFEAPRRPTQPDAPRAPRDGAGSPHATPDDGARSFEARPPSRSSEQGFGQAIGAWERGIRPTLAAVVTAAERVTTAIGEKTTPENERPTGFDTPMGRLHDAADTGDDPDAEIKLREQVETPDRVHHRIRQLAETSEDPDPHLQLRHPLPVDHEHVHQRKTPIL